MTVEAAIFAALKGLVSNRVFPDVAPEGTTRPYITYQQVGGDVISYVGREVPDLDNGRIQITWWADTRAAAKALSVSVNAAMVTATAFQAKPLGAPIASYDEETKLRGYIQDFSVWSNS